VENKMRCRFLPPRQLCAYGLILLIVGPLFAQAAGPDDDKPVVSREAARPRPQTSSDAGGPDLQFVPGALNIIAGTYGKVGDTGDGGPATSAQIGAGYGIAFDPSGNLYFSDGTYNVIRKVDTAGIISTYAGTETANPCHGGYGGDGGPATGAELDCPYQIAFDTSGNLYIADRGNSLIRKVDTSGIITTFAGQFDNNFGGYGGDGGPATSATLNSPQGVAVDANNNVYIADTENNIIRKVDTSGTITTFAGDPNGPPGGGYSGDGGPATSALLSSPYQVAADLAGNIYIADHNNNVIRKVDTAGIISTYAGNGGANCSATSGISGLATMSPICPDSVATDSADDVYLSNSAQVVDLVDINQIISGLAGGGANPPVPGGPATSAYIGVLAETVDTDGNLYALDPVYWVVWEIGPHGSLQFGNQDVGATSAPLTLTLRNPGAAALTFAASPYTISGDFAIISGGSCDFPTGLASGASCTVEVTFTPQSAGALSGTISFATNASGSPQVVELNGTGIAASGPVAALTPSTLAFGNQTTGTTTATPLIATLANSGTATLNISGISITGTNPADFAKSSTTCGATLAAGSSCTISVTFTPASAASFSATLTVTDNASPTTQTSSLTGTGVAAPSDFTLNATPATQTIAAGGSAQYVITVGSTPSGSSFTSAVTLSVTGLPSGATGSFSPASLTPGNSSATSTLSVQTPTTGALESPAAQFSAWPTDRLLTWTLGWPANRAAVWSLASCGLAMFLVPLGLVYRPERSRRLSRAFAVVRSLALIGVSSLSLASCNGGFAFKAPVSPTTYTITVTGTSGTDQHSTTVTLIVQ
jgi:hypothetical protein